MDLALRLMEGGSGSEGLGDGLAIHLAGEAQLRVMARTLGLAQWQVGLPQRRTTAEIEPGRKSPSVLIWRKIWDRSAFSAGKTSGLVILLF